MHETLIKNIKELVPLSQEEVELVSDAFKPRHLKKKEHLLQKGDPSNHMRFVSDGCMKVYSVDEDGQEHVLQFGISGWWINDLYAFLTETPATFFIQAITESTMFQIHRDRLNQLYDEVPMMDRFFRIKTQNGYVALQERTIRSMSETAEQRYSQFINRYRDMEQQIPQYMIASYLGVTPEHLSAIRKKMSTQSLS
ncbi:Crp/Fnr family transcriptional regulator [Ekhidna sp.]|jgi:CRP-like cAMP-binding protein|uniref:Crp/Fnr family transcriptional regulator n=1 Tax=Ekhidna sp. TaxID=2608089 RepID=UPI0032EB6ED5